MTQPPAKTSKKFVGCLIAGGVAMLIGVVGIVIAVYIALTPGKTIASTNIVTGPETLAVLHSKPDLEDPEVAALFDRAIEAYLSASSQQMSVVPANMQWISFFQNKPNTAQARRQFRQFLPTEATLALEPRASGAPAYVGVVNLGHFPRFQLKMYSTTWSLIGADSIEHETSRTTHRVLSNGNTAYNSQPTFFGVFIRNTVVFSDDLDSLKQALDRIDGDVTAEAGGAQALYSEMDDGFVGGVARLDVSTQAGGPAWLEGVQKLGSRLRCSEAGTSTQAVSADEVTIRVVLRCTDAASAAKAKAPVLRALDPHEQELQQLGMSTSRSESVQGSDLTVQYDVSNVGRALDRAFGNMFLGSTGNPPPGTNATPPPLPIP